MDTMPQDPSNSQSVLVAVAGLSTCGGTAEHGPREVIFQHFQLADTFSDHQNGSWISYRERNWPQFSCKLESRQLCTSG